MLRHAVAVRGARSIHAIGEDRSRIAGRAGKPCSRSAVEVDSALYGTSPIRCRMQNGCNAMPEILQSSASSGFCRHRAAWPGFANPQNSTCPVAQSLGCRSGVARICGEGHRVAGLGRARCRYRSGGHLQHDRVRINVLTDVTGGPRRGRHQGAVRGPWVRPCRGR